MHLNDRTIFISDQDILFFPGRGRLQALLDYFRSLFMVSSTNPNAQSYLRSRTSILREKRRHIRNNKEIIHPFSNFRYYWDFLLILGMTINLLIVPYQASFGITRETLIPGIIKNSLLLLCCADMLVNLSTGYFDKSQSIVEMERKKIIKQYMKHGTFFTDLLGSFPTDVIFVRMWDEYKVTREVVSLIYAFRLFSLNVYISQAMYAKNISISRYHFFIIFFWLFVFLHWLTCIFWLVPIATTSLKQLLYPRIDSWIHEIDLWYKPKSIQYLFSLVITIGNCLRSRLYKSDRQNMPDLYVVIVAEIIGTLITWFLIARLVQYFKGTNSSKLRYQSAVGQLTKYMRHKQLPRHTQRRIIDYYEFRFQRRYFRESDIFNALSLQIRQEIVMHSCRKLVENVTFFNNLPIVILNRIVALLKSEIFLTNDVIVRANEPGNCMYFIGSGTVAIYTISGKEVCHLKDGAHFGEIALVMADERRVASVVAVEICELYRLDRADFARTIHPYPMMWEQIKNIAIERHEKTMILST
ncbi:PREDICTED: potassium/sodium hyperpolarization-activated cyclic nucleotide-gated channel 1-like [Polistes canadensis]|uniref:potassium/sodium hyperpolarization-activated cyclic nucleotide-gated channel 1-like n=1 Tax=Polistes canadensis TaxID=91411 RepID=UPI000718FF02|nr:PREDICTED: potassium/sodium hyperpolarization-activated cyclic nucleotide-gated channel 1-like [Polistes canadensis]